MSTARISALSSVPRKAQDKLVDIYREINKNWLKVSRYGGTSRWTDPYRDLQSWPRQMMARYMAADRFLGREFLVVTMHAEAFSNSMRDDRNEDWVALRTLVEENKYSLRMFVLMREVQYVYYYSRTPLANSLGPLMPYHLYHQPNLPHPHEVYLSVTGDIKRCEFTNEATKAISPIVNIPESNYDENIFKQVARPKDWPKLWQYPGDPQYGAESTDGLWHACASCAGQ